MKICRFSAAKIEDDTLSTAKLVSSTFLYLHLTPSISLYFKDMHNNQINTNQKLVTFL